MRVFRGESSLRRRTFGGESTQRGIFEEGNIRGRESSRRGIFIGGKVRRFITAKIRRIVKVKFIFPLLIQVNPCEI
jgi:hypothetical protein